MIMIMTIFLSCLRLLLSGKNLKINNIYSNNSGRISLVDSEQDYYGSMTSLLPKRPNSLPTYEEAILIN
jgi:hypothetical protein